MRALLVVVFFLLFLAIAAPLGLVVNVAQQKCSQLDGGTHFCPDFIFAGAYALGLALVGLGCWVLYREIRGLLWKRPFGPRLTR